MKIKLSVFIACVLFAQVSMAQFALGIKGGVNMTKIQGKAFKDEFNTGYNVGAFLRIGGRLGIQPEVLFNQFVTRKDTAFNSIFSPNFSEKLNYLSIPILLDYKLGNILSLQAGPQVGILMSQNKSLLKNGQDAFKTGDFSMVGGAQIKLSKLRFSGRYIIGLNNISDLQDDTKWKTQGWQLSIGLAL